MFVRDQPTEMDIYSNSLLNQQSTGRHVAPVGQTIRTPNQSVFVRPESIYANYHIQNDSIAPLSIFFMVLIAPINEIQLRHIYL